jgi:anaerobic dimethyl sulfoxide reductase subunit A
MKPAALIPGFAAGRTAYGEQYHRAASALAAMTGNVGIHGGGAAGFDRGPVGSQIYGTPISETKEATYEQQLKALDIPRRLNTRPHACRIWDAILEGTAGGYPSDIKMAYFALGNPLNQLPHINKGVNALKKLDFIVVHEQFMTATARYADILLPVATHWERSDITRPWLSGPYFLYLNKVIEELPEVKTDFQICRELASRLGISLTFMEMPEEEAIGQIMDSIGDMKEEIPDLETFKKDGVHKIKMPGPGVCFKEQIEDPENNPFPTPSGKIEIYCQRIADLNNAEIPPIPNYIEPWEGPDDPLTETYPLQMVTIHHRTRAHSCFDNNTWLKDLEPQSLWINTRDAEIRGIRDGDEVKVFNDRGVIVIPAKVTERIMPGVVSLGEGAWYRPDDRGRDRGGNPNVLTRNHYSPGGSFPFNTSLVQVEKFLEAE